MEHWGDTDWVSVVLLPGDGSVVQIPISSPNFLFLSFSSSPHVLYLAFHSCYNTTSSLTPLVTLTLREVYKLQRYLPSFNTFALDGYMFYVSRRLPSEDTLHIVGLIGHERCTLYKDLITLQLSLVPRTVASSVIFRR